MRPLSELSDEELILGLKHAVACEVSALIGLLKHLAEFDRRGLCLPRGFSSLFVYVTRELGYSEDEAWKRITVAKAARRFPLIYQLLEQRIVNLTAVTRLAPHLTEENHRELLWKAAGRTKIEIEAIVACLDPKPAQRDYIRPLAAIAPPAPAPRLSLTPASLETPRPAAEPDAPAPPRPTLVQFSFSGSGALLAKIQRAKDLLRHKYPRAQLGEIIDDAMDALLDKKDPDRVFARKEKRRRRAALKTGSAGRR